MDFKSIRENGDLLFESIRGSHLFGLNTETSDIDTFGVFCGPEEWLLGSGKDKVAIVKSDKSDDYWDELSKYFFELGKSNPEALVSLFTPKKHILHFDPILQPLWDIKDQLLTKECFKSFSGYAYSQIKKAKGLKKAINTDPETVKERKTPLHFCMVPQGIGTVNLIKWLGDRGLFQEYCGISRLANTNECYSLFYDWGAAEKDKHYIPEEFRGNDVIGYRGILCKDDPLTSQLRLSSIPKHEEPLCWFQFNHNSYTSHCVDYKRYWDWVKNRNEDRFKLNSGHNYDCYSSALTRFLTKRGWLSFEEIDYTDELACFDSKGEIKYSYQHSRTEYNPVDGLTLYSYVDEDNKISFHVTDNHRLYLREEGSTDFKLITVKDWYEQANLGIKYYQLSGLRKIDPNPKWCNDEIFYLAAIIGFGIVENMILDSRYLLIPQDVYDISEVVGYKINKEILFSGKVQKSVIGIKVKLDQLNSTVLREITEALYIDGNWNLSTEILNSFSDSQLLFFIESLYKIQSSIRNNEKVICITKKNSFWRMELCLTECTMADIVNILRVRGYSVRCVKLEIGSILYIKRNRTNEVYLDPSKLVAEKVRYSDSKNKVVCFETKTGTLVTKGWSEDTKSFYPAFHGNSKNISHCVRIFTMAKEIAEGKGMILDRTGIDRDFLLSIKNHEKSYDEVMKYVEDLKDEMEEAFIKSTLPECPDQNLLDKLQIDIRKKHYGRKKV